jgi:hypothetical protein
MKASVQAISIFIKKVTIAKVLLLPSILIICLFLFSGIAKAQDTYPDVIKYNTYSINSNVNPDVPLNTHNGIQILFLEFLSTIHCQLTGVNPLGEGNKCLGVDKETGKIGFIEEGGGAVMVIGSLIDSLFIPPASGIGYLAHLKNDFGITKKTYAQSGPQECLNSANGIGFCAIEPLLPVWKTMRNIVYLLFILVFIVIGMGIMLRIHIDPRTVMTIQNQIPKIIVGIVAISFSFAIAGFLIDVMYLSIYLFTSTIAQATPGVLDLNNSLRITQATDPFQALNTSWQIATGEEVGIWHISERTAGAFAGIVVSALTEAQGALGFLWDLFGGMIHVFGTIFLVIAIIILLIKVFIVLLLAFLNIILDIIFAPWWILAGLFPGGPLGLGAWIRDLIANLAVFPVTIGFMLLGSYLMNAFYSNSDQFGRMNFPLLGSAGTNSQAIAALIGFGFILMLPNLLKATKAALKTPNMNFGPLFGPLRSSGGIITSIPKRGQQVAGLEGRWRYARTAQGASRRQQLLRFFRSPYERDDRH